MARINVDGVQQDREKKSRTLSLLMLVPFLVLALRLYYIQIIKGEKNLSLSIDNQVVIETLKASRGIIYDRNGLVLARNRPSYSLRITPYYVPKNFDIKSKLLKIRDRKGEYLFDSLDLSKKLERAKYRRARSTLLKEDISIDYVSIIREHSMELPGIEIVTESRREYPFGADAYHVVGYLGQISPKNMDSLKLLGYQKGDLIGKSGIEKEYESYLHGQDGLRYVEKNVYGRRLGVVKSMPYVKPVRGDNIYLSIDAKLQEVTANAFPDTLKGAVVALNPKTGEVLAMVSKPSLNPNIFSLDLEKRAKEWRKVAFDSNRPLTNRAVDGVYPPGSTFKLVSGMSFVGSGKVKPYSYMPQPCTGAFRIGNRLAHCWNLSGHGYLNLPDAIKVSCNIYFYQGGLIVGDSIINDYSTRLGLGEKTGVDLPHEKKGWLSGEKAYNERYKNKKPRPWVWTQGLVLDMAIGQAQVFTPIQLATMVGAIGNGKERYTPFLLKEIRTGDGIVLEQIEKKDSVDLHLDTTALNAVKEGMRRVVMVDGGTGRRVRVPGIDVGGKSGSAQNPHGDKTHALFVAVAPLDDPVIAVAAVVENAGHGGSVAGPIVGEMLRYYFKNSKDGIAAYNAYQERHKK